MEGGTPLGSTKTFCCCNNFHVNIYLNIYHNPITTAQHNQMTTHQVRACTFLNHLLPKKKWGISQILQKEGISSSPKLVWPGQITITI